MARTVLLADDSVTAQNMGRRILTDAGYEVVTVNNGSAALKKVHESRPDLIVLDVYMPGYGGLEVCQRLKESADTMRIPVLLTVGKMEPFKSDEAKRVRADGHIVKPFEASELLAALTKLEDRIVPAMDARGRKGKSDKKARAWHAGDDPVNAPEEWTDRVAYLADAKQHRMPEEPEVAPEPAESRAPAPKPAAAAEPAPEMPVIADALAEDQAEDQRTGGSHSAVSGQIADATPALAESESAPANTVSAEAANSDGAPQSQAAPEAVFDQEITAELASSQAVVSAKPRWIAENVALSAEEAALQLEREMQQSQLQTVVEAATGKSEEIAAVPSESTSEPAERNGASFAAAAAASASTSTVVSTPVPSSADAADNEAPPAGLDATAAWKNWEQIRDSVMTSQNSGVIEAAVAGIANAVPAIADAAPAERADLPSPANGNNGSIGPIESAATQSETSQAETSRSETIQGDALASIVDSVLAELKPKLMEQIAKKLAADKK